MIERFECEWCGEEEAYRSRGPVFWELPDGSRAIEITGTPQVFCSGCGIVFTEEAVTIELEDQLLLIDTKPLGEKISYRDLMKIERKLKRNYFRFD
ncbi:YokU family protein [Rossellomorea vietnamensis]|uniref:YokU family protein n=1 Tax=Rossellomorea vietnamensis TaxID=218284 RepID=A0A5D4NZK3_9BACI|nr:YokU family protein [Rossellomorea vietnamensis]TYS18826.1 YokU family protein [Rossellomorea vietnamensis]